MVVVVVVREADGAKWCVSREEDLYEWLVLRCVGVYRPGRGEGEGEVCKTGCILRER